MDQSIPDHITIRYALNPNITATYNKYQRITFTSPDELKGRVVGSIFGASYVVRNAPSFPYSDWIVTDCPDAWSVWSYEHSVSTFLKRLKTSDPSMTDAKIDLLVEDQERKKDSETLIDPRTLTPDKWTSGLVSDWICYRKQPALKLKKIIYYRRYNPGLSFEFLCVWDGPNLQEVMSWQKYTDLQQNPQYAEYIRLNWDAKTEKDRNWEDEIDRHSIQEEQDNGMDVNLPEIGTAYAMEKDSIKAHKTMEREERKYKDRKRKQKRKSRHSKNAKADSDSAGSEEVSDISSDESDIELTSEDEDDKKQTTNKIHMAELDTDSIEWMDIFDQSSVSPIPRYKIKKFKTSA